jgi:hypothetical protein
LQAVSGVERGIGALTLEAVRWEKC